MMYQSSFGCAGAIVTAFGTPDGDLDVVVDQAGP